MLKVVGIGDVRLPDSTLVAEGPLLGVVWERQKDRDVLFWQIDSPGQLLQLGCDQQTREVYWISVIDWRGSRVEAINTLQDLTRTPGHPLVDLDILTFEGRMATEENVRAFVIEMCDSHLMIRWGAPTRLLMSGRVMFAVDANDDVVGVGCDQLSAQEALAIRRELALVAGPQAT